MSSRETEALWKARPSRSKQEGGRRAWRWRQHKTACSSLLLWTINFQTTPVPWKLAFCSSSPDKHSTTSASSPEDAAHTLAPSHLCSSTWRLGWAAQGSSHTSGRQLRTNKRLLAGPHKPCAPALLPSLHSPALSLSLHVQPRCDMQPRGLGLPLRRLLTNHPREFPPQSQGRQLRWRGKVSLLTKGRFLQQAGRAGGSPRAQPAPPAAPATLTPHGSPASSGYRLGSCRGPLALRGSTAPDGLSCGHPPRA